MQSIAKFGNTMLVQWVVSLILLACVDESNIIVQSPYIHPSTSVTVHEDAVTLKWANPYVDITEFEVERKINIGNYEKVVTLDSKILEYKDVGLHKFEKIYYRIRSKRANATSEYIDFQPVIIGEFSNHSSHMTERSSANLITLNDGRVIMTSGVTYNQYEASYEVYDPVSSEWTQTDSFPTNAWGHKSILLDDGRLLITGGTYSDDHFKNTFLFDPVSNSFEQGPDLNYPHSNHSINKLSDGRVLIVGGQRANSAYSNIAEIYDPDLNSWQVTRTLNDARSGHQVYELDNGDVFIAGGYGIDREGYPLSSMERYIAEHNIWVRVGELEELRSVFASFKTQHNSIVFIGNKHWPGGIGSEEVDLSDFKLIGESQSMQYGYESLDMIHFGNEFVLLLGINHYDEYLNMEVYDLNTGEWLLTNSLPFTNIKSVYSKTSLRGINLTIGSILLVEANSDLESVVFKLNKK